MKMHHLFFVLSAFFIFPLKSQPQSANNTPDSLMTGRLRKVIIAESALYTSGLLFLNNIWYKDHQPTPFHFYNDNRGWLQIDKVGHMYSAYYQSYYGVKALRWAGVPKKKAIWWGGMMGLILQTPIEVFDGLYEGYGFSYGDMIANATGSALVISQELLWEEQIVIMKFSYSSTSYPQYRPSYFGETKSENFFIDYNGHTYWLSANVSKLIPALKAPKWLNIAIGYGGEGMLAEFENPTIYEGTQLPSFDRIRQWYLSFDVDLRKLNVRSKFLKAALQVLNMVKFPAPALEFSNNKLTFHIISF